MAMLGYKKVVKNARKMNYIVTVIVILLQKILTPKHHHVCRSLCYASSPYEAKKKSLATVAYGFHYSSCGQNDGGTSKTSDYIRREVPHALPRTGKSHWKSLRVAFCESKVWHAAGIGVSIGGVFTMLTSLKIANPCLFVLNFGTSRRQVFQHFGW